MIRIDIEESAIDAEVARFTATVEQAETARLRALRKTAKWMSKKVIQAVAKKERMPQRALHNRVFVSKIGRGATEADVFIGTMPVDATRIGRPVQTGSGVKVGRQSHPGAFVGRIYTGKEKVWIRLGSKYYDPARYPTRHRKGDRFGGNPSLLGRFPVVKAAVPINDTVEEVVEMFEADVPAEFFKHLRHELNYEANVR